MADPYQAIGHLTKALGDPNRLFILERMAQRPCGVDELSRKTGFPVPNLSHHLQILKYAGLVKSTRKGRQIIYTLAGTEVIHAILALRVLSEHLTGTDDKVSATLKLANGPKLPREEVLQMVKDGKAVVLDVRPLDEFKAGHIRGALHIPLEELDQRREELPEGKIIVAYCRGPYCQLAVQAVERLTDTGWVARSLEDGYPEWWASGHPVETLDNDDDSF